MARGMMGLMLVVVLTAMRPSSAVAQSLGNFCWNLSPFVDTVLLSITQQSPNFNLNGRWRALGGNAVGGTNGIYQLLGAGTATPSATKGNTIDAGFQAVHNTGFFGGNRGCNLSAEIDSLTLNGTWTVQCPGPAPFTASGNLINISSCPANF